MPKAVQFKEYGDVDVLELVEVEKPKASGKEVVVKVKAAGINPGEAKIRDGSMHSVYPASFPSGEGADFAGIVEEIGPDVSSFKVGDEVAGHTESRGSHAEVVKVDESLITMKPKSVSFEVAGSLWVAGTTAYGAVKAVGIKAGDKVIVSAAGGGVGSLAVQLAKLEGADAYGIAGEHDLEWLESLGIKPINYKKDVAAEIKSLTTKPDAFIDTVGKGYVKMAIDLGVDPQRIDTIIDFQAVSKYRVKSDGSAAAARMSVFEELLNLIANNKLVVPIAKTYPLAEVKEAYNFLSTEHHRGKVVLTPN